MRVLISGFEPFGGRDLNPTALLLNALKQNEIPFPRELSVESILLPVTFEDSFNLLQQKIEVCNPDVILAFGQAAGRASIELENLAFNIINAEIKDNKGIQPLNKLINPLGADCFHSTLPLQGFEGALKDAGVRVKMSHSAGAYVCNYLFYRLMETNQDTLRLCGFIHVPLLPEQARESEPSMSLEEMKKALSVILTYINY